MNKKIIIYAIVLIVIILLVAIAAMDSLAINGDAIGNMAAVVS